jgi:PAS domain S-box-containing protein
MVVEHSVRGMTKEILDVTNWLFLGIMIVYLFKIIRNLRRQKTKNIILGISLIFFGTAVEVSYHFEQFNKFIKLGETGLEGYLQDFAGFLFALLFLTLGIFIIEFGMKESKLQKEYEINAENRNLLQAVLDTTSHGICYVRRGINRWSNKALTNILGWESDELSGPFSRNLYESEEEYKEIEKRIEISLDRAKSVKMEYEFLHKDGHKVPCILLGNPVDRLRSDKGFIFSFTDITEYALAMERLGESEEKYRTIIENTDEGYYELTLKGIFTFVNNAAINIFNFKTTDIVNRSISELMPKRTAEAIMTVFRTVSLRDEALKNLHWKFKTADDVRHIETSIVPKKKGKTIIGYRGVSRDITERQKLQEQAAENQRLASLGEMAAGIAHEINNPISGVINYAELLTDSLMPKSEEYVFANEIVKEGQRIAKIVKNLLAFARKEEVEKSPNDIEEILNDALNLFKANTKKHGVIITKDIHDSLQFIMCSRHQIQQVFINLLSNSIFSLNEKYPNIEEMDKVVEIKIRSHREFLRVEFKDHGTGMKKDIMKRIFEPFFTTKRPDFGTGLGLSVSYGIIKDHNGQIRVDSEYGKWTKFTIDLPRMRNE